MSENCIFCKIVAGEIPSTKVDEDDKAFAFMDINPWNKGHTLVIPKEHAVTIFELSEDSAAAVMRLAHRVAPAVLAATGAEGMNLFQSNGKAAWQQVDHVHMHLIPRWRDDELKPPTSPQPGDMEEIAAVGARIREALT